MGYGEKRGDYWRARYKIAPGKYRTLADANGELLRFRTKRAAEQAANEEEAKVRGGRWHDPAAARITFGEYANRWYAAQDLALSTCCRTSTTWRSARSIGTTSSSGNARKGGGATRPPP